MRSLLLLLICLAAATLLQAQSYPGAKVYAYSQSVASGARPQNEVGIDGTEAPAKKNAGSNFWIYFTHPHRVDVYVSELYINGKKYSFRTEAIEDNKVEYTHVISPDESDTTVLVPASSNKILFVVPAETVGGTPSPAVKKLLPGNAVVIGYTIKNRKYYTAQPTIKKLQRASMQ